jgi:hypothetical protein
MAIHGGREMVPFTTNQVYEQMPTEDVARSLRYPSPGVPGMALPLGGGAAAVAGPGTGGSRGRRSCKSVVVVSCCE